MIEGWMFVTHQRLSAGKKDVKNATRLSGTAEDEDVGIILLRSWMMGWFHCNRQHRDGNTVERYLVSGAVTVTLYGAASGAIQSWVSLGKSEYLVEFV
ncbi:hypothetical protein DL93DRAFT_2087999, partial [Clavulina sp. PMI_390]